MHLFLEYNFDMLLRGDGKSEGVLFLVDLMPHLPCLFSSGKRQQWRKAYGTPTVISSKNKPAI